MPKTQMPAYLQQIFQQLETRLPALVDSGTTWRLSLNCDGRRIRVKLEDYTCGDVQLDDVGHRRP